MKVATIVLNFNGGENTLESLKSLFKLQLFENELEIIVIDNGSTDDSVEKIENLKLKIENKQSLFSRKLKNNKEKFKIVLIKNKENLGFSEGNNVGINYALKNNFDYVLLVNNDTIVRNDLLIQLIKAAEKSSRIGIVSPKIYFAPGFEFHYERYKNKDRGKVIWYAGGLIDWKNVLTSHRGVDEIDQGQYDKLKETDFATGCCMLVKKEVFEKIGLFDKKYFLYWEDVDFCQRAKKAGFKIFYVFQAVIWHKNASSSGGAGGDLSVYYQTRNRLLFTFKYASLKSKIAVLKEGLSFLFGKNFWQRKAVKNFFLLSFGKMKK